MKPLEQVHPVLRRIQWAHIGITAVLLLLLAVSHLADAFAPRRTLIQADWKEYFGRANLVPMIAYGLIHLGLYIVMALAIPRLLGAPAVTKSREARFKIRGMPITSLLKGIELRLRAGRFDPDGSPPDPRAPRLEALRPKRMHFDSYESPSLAVRFDLTETDDGIDVVAVVTRRQWVFGSVDTGESIYDASLLEHLVTGEPRRRIRDAGGFPILGLYAAHLMAITLIGLLYGWIPAGRFQDIGVLALALPLMYAPLSLFQVWRAKYVSGTELACHLALLLPCAAMMIRGTL